MEKPTVDIYRSEIDGAWVVHVDTVEESREDCDAVGPKPLRIYVNDGDAIYENPPLPKVKV
jgi:hypothetical protein